MRAQQLVHEAGLFEDVERPLPAGAQQAGDALRLVFSPRDIRHAFDAQFRGTPISPEAIQQQAALRRIDTTQRLFDPALGNRSQQARFGQRRSASGNFRSGDPGCCVPRFRSSIAPSRRVLVEKTKNIFAPRQPVEAALSHTLSQRLEEFRRRLIVRPSSTLATIARYGSRGEFTKVTSSSVKPSSANFTSSHAGGFRHSEPAAWMRHAVRQCGARLVSTRTRTHPKRRHPRRPASCRGAATSGDIPCSPPPAATLRFPLRCFLFLRPLVGLIVLLAPRVGLLATMVLTATELAAEVLPIGIPWMRQKANPAVAAVDRTACQTGMIAQDGIQRQLILTNKRMGAVGPDANPDEMKKFLRPLPQKHQVLG